METKTKTLTQTFSDWIKKISVAKYTRIREDITKQCQISPKTFYNWQEDKTPINPLSPPIINKIAEKWDVEKPFNL